MLLIFLCYNYAYLPCLLHFKAINLFISNADFVPDVPRVDVGQPLYASYRFVEEEWGLIHKIHDVLKVGCQ